MTSIFDTISSNQELKMFATAIQIANLSKTLHGSGPFTVFAPLNRAFTQRSKVAIQELTADLPLLTNTISSHIVLGSITYECMLKMCKPGQQKIALKSINGSPLSIDLSDGIKIGDATVVSTDISAENGIIYAIDRLLVPTISPQPQQFNWLRKFSRR